MAGKNKQPPSNSAYLLSFFFISHPPETHCVGMVVLSKALKIPRVSLSFRSKIRKPGCAKNLSEIPFVYNEWHSPSCVFFFLNHDELYSKSRKENRYPHPSGQIKWKEMTRIQRNQEKGSPSLYMDNKDSSSFPYNIHIKYEI